MQTKRDEQLDILRSVSIFWVVVIHALYWSGLFSDGYALVLKSYLLAEMPLVFFVSGAANSFSVFSSFADIKKYWTKRFRRIIIPYWIYAVVCIVANLVWSHVFQNELPAHLVLRWLLPLEIQSGVVPYLTWALWFIPVYLVLMLVFPFFKLYFSKASSTLTRLLPLVFFVLINVILSATERDGAVSFAKKYSFYAFWMYCGQYWDTLKATRSRKTKLAALAFALLAAAGVSAVCGYLEFPVNMQENKFPPNTAFFLFTLAAMSLFYCASDIIIAKVRFLKKFFPFSWLYKAYSQSGYSIYLYQPFVFVAITYSFKLFGIHGIMMKHDILGALVIVPLAVVGSAVLGSVMSRAERLKIK